MRCGWALSAFSLGLPAYVLIKVLTPGYYAREDTRTPVRYAMLSVGVNIVGNPHPDPVDRACRSAARNRARPPASTLPSFIKRSARVAISWRTRGFAAAFPG